MTLDLSRAPDHADVVIVGGGHNALVAATYLARAGLDVVVLERLGARRRRGGQRAAVRRSRRPPVALLLPRQPDAAAARSTTSGCGSSCGRATPPPTRRTTGGGLLVETVEGEATRDVVPRRSPAPTTSSTRGRRFYAEVATARRRHRPDPARQPLPHIGNLRDLSRDGDLDRPRRRAARHRDRAPLRPRPRPRRRRHRRADRHVRLAARPDAGAEPLLPLPPDRQRHGRVARAGRRHGRGHRRARAGRREAGATIRTDSEVTASTCRDDGVDGDRRRLRRSTADSRAQRRRARTCWPACWATRCRPSRPARSSRSTCWCRACRG